MLFARSAAVLCLSLLPTSLLAAPATTQMQPPPPPGRTDPGERLTVANMQASCNAEAIKALIGKRVQGVVVKQTVNGPKLDNGVRYTPPRENVPGFCQVSGSFVTNPKTGKTANFLATFPERWNHKFLQIGCGGFCGMFAVNNPASSTITISLLGTPPEAIEKGYAMVGTDEGHTAPVGSGWAVLPSGGANQDAIDDYLYRADQVLASTGKALTTTLYSQLSGAPQKIVISYFMGCSDGGRDALVAATVFPDEFDGIVSGSPYANMIGVSYQSAAVALAMIRSKDADVTPELMSRVDPIVKAKCDTADGVKDGLMQNPGACDFRPDRDLPRCVDNLASDECFTQAQVESISTLVTAVTDEHGNVVEPGYSISEVQDVLRMPPPSDPLAIEPWSAGQLPAQELYSLSDGVLRVFVHKNDPTFHVRQQITFGQGGTGQITAFHAIVPQAEVASAKAAVHIGIGGDPAAIAPFFKRGGKLLLWANLSDQLLTPYMTINYYKELSKIRGGYAKLQDVARLFLIPGTAHCSMSGCGPGNFDALTAIEQWVEQRHAPDNLLATQYAGKPFDPKSMAPPAADYSRAPLRTMPLCKFPEMARFAGHGDVKDASNWNCPKSDTSMLKIGESGRQAGIAP